MDKLGLQVAPAPEDAGGGFQVEIYVNDVEMTAAGAGLGMDPYDVLVPQNRFLACDEPTTIPVARCGCGVYGCGSTDVTITRDGDVVHWDWKIEVPMHRRVTFAADAYEREVARVAGDYSWETPDRTAGRLVLSTLDRSLLPPGFKIDWLGNKWGDSDVYRVCLGLDRGYQIFVDFEWGSQSPEVLATAVRRVLVEMSPREWSASWHAIQRTDMPPTIAGERWTREQY